MVDEQSTTPKKSASGAAKSARTAPTTTAKKSDEPASGHTSTRVTAEPDPTGHAPTGDGPAAAPHETTTTSSGTGAGEHTGQPGVDATTSSADSDAAAAAEPGPDRPTLTSGQMLAGGSTADYPPVHTPRATDPDLGTGTVVPQHSAVSTLSPTRLDERNRVGDVSDEVKAAQFPTPRFNQGPPTVVVATQVPAVFADQYVQAEEDGYEAVYRPGCLTPSTRQLWAKGQWVRRDYMTANSHAASTPDTDRALAGTHPGDTDKDEHRAAVAGQ